MLTDEDADEDEEIAVLIFSTIRKIIHFWNTQRQITPETRRTSKRIIYLGILQRANLAQNLTMWILVRTY